VHGWNSVDNALDRLSLRVGVTLVVRALWWMEEYDLMDVIEGYFPSMWKKGRVTLQVPPPDMEDELLRHVPPSYWLAVGR